jgi:tetratricopeptide (TPR) repeat protein
MSDSPRDILSQAVRLHQAGQLDPARQLYQKVLATDPKNPNALHLLGYATYQSGDPLAGLELVRQALALDSSRPEYHCNLGVILSSLNRHQDAVGPFRTAISIRPNFPEAHYNLGVSLAELERFEEAIQAYQSALAARPNWPDALSNLGTALMELKQFSQAQEVFEKATQLNPQFAQAWYNLGNALRQEGKLEPAKAMFHRALEITPDYPEALTNLGQALMAQGKINEALETYDRVIRMHPDFALAHWNRSYALFAKGDWTPAWREYEWRWKVESLHLKKPAHGVEWDGSDLRGRTILLYSEAAFGDAIHFFRFAQVIAQRAAKVIVQVPRELVRLFREGTGIEIVSIDQPLPDFDVQYPLMSLPLVLGTTEQTIPARRPYLFADPMLVSAWRPKMPADPNLLRVGIAWRGRPNPDPQRSIPSEFLEPLGTVPNVWFLNLQVGHTAAAPPFPIADFRNQMNDFASVAAAMANLDLVLTIDSASAHLAGALGLPTWTLLKFAPDWRWLRDRDDSPFYPTMRLFRQPTPGDWTSVIRQVAQQLHLLAKSPPLRPQNRV